MSRIAIVSTDCKTSPVTPDRSGYFLVVIPGRLLYRGYWPAWALAYDAAGKIVAKQPLRLPDPKMQINGGHPRPTFPSPGRACTSG